MYIFNVTIHRGEFYLFISFLHFVLTGVPCSLNVPLRLKFSLLHFHTLPPLNPCFRYVSGTEPDSVALLSHRQRLRFGPRAEPSRPAELRRADGAAEQSASHVCLLSSSLHLNAHFRVAAMTSQTLKGDVR